MYFVYGTSYERINILRIHSVSLMHRRPQPTSTQMKLKAINILLSTSNVITTNNNRNFVSIPSLISVSASRSLISFSNRCIFWHFIDTGTPIYSKPTGALTTLRVSTPVSIIAMYYGFKSNTDLPFSWIPR